MKTFTSTKDGFMKHSVTAIAMAVVFAACGSHKSDTALTKDVVTTDTAGLYTDQNKVMNVDGVNDTTITTVTTTTITRSGNAPQEVAVAPAPKVIYKTVPAKSTTKSTSGNGTYSSGNSASTASQPTAQAQKKGWSKAAKGAVIGAGSGAVLGAVVSKKKGLGAVIGGVVGAGVGYGVGRAKDKKDGRY